MSPLLEIYAIGAALVSLVMWREMGKGGQSSRERIEMTFFSALVWPLTLVIGFLYAARNRQHEAELMPEDEEECEEAT